MNSLPSVREWITDTAQEIAERHAISPRTVRGWLATGHIDADVAEHLAAMADYGISPEMLNAMVYALVQGQPIGDLEYVT